MQAVKISGRFVNDHKEPIDGLVRFSPSVLWVDEGDESIAVLMPELRTKDGYFETEISRTDTGELPWHYTVHSPAGRWTIQVLTDGPLQLKDLLPKRYA